GKPCTVAGEGNGPIAAFVDALRTGLGVNLDVVDYAEHAIGQGADATAVAYVETTGDETALRWGAGVHPNIITASLRAVLSALAPPGVPGARCSPPCPARDEGERRDASPDHSEAHTCEGAGGGGDGGAPRRSGTPRPVRHPEGGVSGERVTELERSPAPDDARP